MYLPPAPQKYNRDNEAQSRKLTIEAITDLEARMTAVESAETTPPPPTGAPTASFSYVRRVNRRIDFTDTSTDVAPGTIASRSWDFGDGSTSTLQNPTHTYATTGTFTVRLTVRDNDGLSSAEYSEAIVVSNSPRTMINIQGLPVAMWGLRPYPDTNFIGGGSTGGVNLVTAGGDLDEARARGARLITRPTGGNANIQTDNGVGHERDFDLNKAKSRFDLWLNGVRSVNRVINGVSKNGEQILREAVRDFVYLGVMSLDDWTEAGSGANAFTKIPTYNEVEGDGTAAMGGIIGFHRYIKLALPWMPVIPRAHGTFMKTFATLNGVVRPYRFTDCAWSQYRGDQTALTAAQYFAQETTAAAAANLTNLRGVNLLDGGEWVNGNHPITGASQRIHADVAWRAPRVGETLSEYDARMSPQGPGNFGNLLFGMSPTEIETAADGAYADVSGNGVGFLSWSYGFNAEWNEDSEIKGAWNYVYDTYHNNVDPFISKFGQSTPA